VRDAISGYVCRSVKELAKRAVNIDFNPRALREYVEAELFSSANGQRIRIFV
jgi:hypothetical protein